MGDPKKQRRKYHRPTQRWHKQRILDEREILKEYGLKNKTEIWRMSSLMEKFKDRAKEIIKLGSTSQAEKEKKEFLQRLENLGVVQPGSTLDNVLGLELKTFLERRLQTIVVRKGLARSVKQSRQFITHRHISINNIKVTSPSYYVTKQDEGLITFSPTSGLADPEHPERTLVQAVVKGE